MQENKTLKDFTRLLALFNDLQTEELSVTEISKSLGMSPSKVSRTLGTLDGEGLFEKNAKSGKYRLGILFFELGIAYAYHLPLRKIVRPHIEQMAKELKFTVSWGIMRKNRVIVLDRIQNLPIDVLAYRVGLNLPIHTTSIGKTLMAFLEEAQQDEILNSIKLNKVTDYSVVDPTEIRANLQKYKKQGYATDEEETYEGVNCIAVPIRNGTGEIIAAISLMDDNMRTEKKVLFENIPYLKEKSLFISRQLGYRDF